MQNLMKCANNLKFEVSEPKKHLMEKVFNV